MTPLGAMAGIFIALGAASTNASTFDLVVVSLIAALIGDHIAWTLGGHE